MSTARVFYVIFGVLLLLAGVVALLETSGALPSFDATTWRWLTSAGFALAGLTFLGLFFTDPQRRWPAVIPASVLLAIAATVFLDAQGGAWSGTAFLGAIGIGFLMIFVAQRALWWSLIPAGVLLTLATVAAPSAGYRTDGYAQGIIFFLGLALTFFAVFATRGPAGRRKWALIPAVILAALGGMVALVSLGWIDTNATWWLYLGPVLLLLGGAFLLYKAATRKAKPAPDEKPPVIPG